MLVVLCGFSVRLLCLATQKHCMYFVAVLVLVCVDVMVMSQRRT